MKGASELLAFCLSGPPTAPFLGQLEHHHDAATCLAGACVWVGEDGRLGACWEAAAAGPFRFVGFCDCHNAHDV